MVHQVENPNKYLIFRRHPREGGDPEPSAEREWQVPPFPDGVCAMAPISRAALDPRLRGDDDGKSEDDDGKSEDGDGRSGDDETGVFVRKGSVPSPSWPHDCELIFARLAGAETKA